MDRINPNHPLAEAARASNTHAASHGLQHTVEDWAEMDITVEELMYLAEQRALRAVAALSFGVDLGGSPENPERDNMITALVQTMPGWPETKILLMSAYMDGFVIGWKGHEIKLDRS